MTPPLKIIMFLFFGFAAQNILAQKSDDPQMTSLMVYGNGFMFGVKEPAGWTGNTENGKKYYANIIFYRNKEDLDNGGALIQVYNFEKKDEETLTDLQFDIKGYEDKYKDLKEQNLEATHAKYQCYARTVYVENSFYQYTVYVNPGPKYKSGLSVGMNISKRPATEEELKAFREIIASLIMFKG